MWNNQKNTTKFSAKNFFHFNSVYSSTNSGGNLETPKVRLSSERVQINFLKVFSYTFRGLFTCYLKVKCIYLKQALKNFVFLKITFKKSEFMIQS